MKKIRTLLIFLFVFAGTGAFPQDFPYQFFTHIFDGVNNPANTANANDIEVDVATYNLWAAGFKPVNDYLMHFEINPAYKKYRDESKVGIGATVLRDRIGSFVHNLMHLNYAYHLMLDRRKILSLGVCGLIENLSVDLNGLNPLNPDDPRILAGNNSSLIFDGGFGATLNTEKIEFGLSVLNLAPANFQFKNNSVKNIGNYRKFYTRFKYLLEIDSEFILFPQIAVRNNRLKQIRYDAALECKWNKFSFGAGFRSKSSLFVYTKIPFKDFVFSYTSENPLKSNHMVGNGHTFSLGYMLANNK